MPVNRTLQTIRFHLKRSFRMHHKFCDLFVARRKRGRGLKFITTVGGEGGGRSTALSQSQLKINCISLSVLWLRKTYDALFFINLLAFVDKLLFFENWLSNKGNVYQRYCRQLIYRRSLRQYGYLFLAQLCVKT